MRLRPLNDRLVVIRLDAEQKTSGGIVIPDTAREKPHEGRIMAAGPGRIDKNGCRIPMEVREGDRIVFSKYAGNEINIDGEVQLVMREDDVLGILD